MPKKDKYHDAAKQALINDGWTVTHDPIYISVLGTDFPADLGAEKIIAEKGIEKIVVEVKSFLGLSVVNEFHTVLGQFLNYELGLSELESDREVYIGLTTTAYYRIEETPILMKSIEKFSIKFVVFDKETKKVKKWIK